MILHSAIMQFRRRLPYAVSLILSLLVLLAAAGCKAGAQAAHIMYSQSTVTSFRQPAGVVGDAAGNLYVTDNWNSRLLKETPNGSGGYTQAVLDTAVNQPWGIGMDGTGALYVSNEGASQILKYVFAPDGTFTRTVVLNVSATGLAVDPAGNLVYCYNTGCSRATLSGGVYTTSTLYTTSQQNGIALDAAGNVYISDYSAGQVVKFDRSNNKSILSLPGISRTNPPGQLSVDAQGNLYVAVSYEIYQYQLVGGSYNLNPIPSVSLTYDITCLWVDAAGRVFAGDGLSYALFRFTPALLGLAPAVSFGALPVGTASAPQTLTFTFDTQGTLAATPFLVTVKGDTALDFKPAATQPANVCVTGQLYHVGDTCAVSVTFTPVAPGVRAGALTLYASSGLPAATAYLQGMGNGPQIAFDGWLGGSQISYYQTKDVAMDDSGNSYVYSYPNGTYRFNTLTGVDNTPSGFGGGSAFAIDGAGNVFSASNRSLSATYFSPTGYGQIAYLSSSPVDPSGVAVDTAGNIYVADRRTVWKETYSNGGYTETQISTPVLSPGYIAADSSGNFYLADPTGNQVLMFTPGTGGVYSTTTVGSGLSGPSGVAVDGMGNVYITDNGHNRILKETPSGGTFTQTVVHTFGASPFSVAADPWGNLVISLAYSQTEGVVTLIAQKPYPQGFTTTAVGSISSNSPVTVNAFNIGNQPLVFTVPSGSGLNPSISSGFTLSQSGSSVCPQLSQTSSGFSLAPGASCANLISFQPVTSGAITGTETFTDNSLNVTNAQQSIPLSGTATGGPALTITPTSISFPSTAVGSSSTTMTATVSNSGTAAVDLTQGALTDSTDFTQSDNCGGIVIANGSCTVTFTFTPQAAGSLSSTYTVADKNNPGSPLTVTLSGTGIGSTSLTIAPATISFPATGVGTSSSPMTATLTLHGGSTRVNLTSGTLTDATEFTQSDNCSGSITPGGSCTVTFNFTPKSTGSLSSTYSIAEAGSPASAVSVALNGNGTAQPGPTLSPSAVNFGGVNVGTTSNGQVVTLNNPASVPLQVSSIVITGANASAFTQSNTCGNSVAAGSSCAINVVCSPPATVALSATLAVSFTSFQQGSVALSCNGVAPAAALSPSSFNFGSVLVGGTASASNFTLSNAGSAPLQINSVTLTGTNAADFHLAANTCGSLLSPAANCNIAISFTASIAGSESATLVVTDAVGTQTASLVAAGLPVTPPDFTIAATPATQSSYRGHSVTYQLALGSKDPTNPFTSPVALSLTGLPANVSATFAPASVTPGAAGNGSTLTLTIAPLSSSVERGMPFSRGTAAVASIGLMFLFGRRKRTTRGLLLAVFGLACMTAMSGCGSGGSGFAIPSPTTSITVTGTSGSTAHSTTVTLTVQ